MACHQDERKRNRFEIVVMGRLQNKIALITGGGSGIGLATARVFAREGATVIICGRTLDTLQTAAATVHGEITTFVADTSRLDDLDRLFKYVGDDFGALDVLFCNAGWSNFQPFDSITEEMFDDHVNGNLKSTFFTIQKAVPILKPGASVLINGSVVANKGWPNTNITAAIKAAQRSLARTLSTELMEQRVRVNTISPGPIDTAFFGHFTDDDGKAKKNNLRNINPTKRLGKAEEVAELALFLASEDSSWILGGDFGIDGGASNLP